MSFILIPFRAAHASVIKPQAAQIGAPEMMEWKPEDWIALEGVGEAYTGYRDGRLLGFAGVIPQWFGRALTWMLLSDEVHGMDMRFIFNQTRDFLDRKQQEPAYRRIETSAQETFPQGHRFARMLGFVPEGQMRCYDPKGNTHTLYARVR